MAFIEEIIYIKERMGHIQLILMNMNMNRQKNIMTMFIEYKQMIQ